jgi:RNA exonuclease 4
VLAIDCEYVGTGFEDRDDMLARVSIVDDKGSVIFDKYVKPTDDVTDYRTAVAINFLVF